jgi:hypothetical protein
MRDFCPSTSAVMARLMRSAVAFAHGLWRPFRCPCAPGAPTTEDMTTALFKHAEIDHVRRRAIEYFTQLQSLTADQPTQRRTARSIERRSNAVKPDLIFQAATIYNQHIDGTPLKAVRERLGISKSTSEKYIRLAREAGYVTESAKPGRRQKP